MLRSVEHALIFSDDVRAAAENIVGNFGLVLEQVVHRRVAQDNVESRRGYSGLYQLGASYNPGKFKSTTNNRSVSGNYLIYDIASQAVDRRFPETANGIDLTGLAHKAGSQADDKSA